MRPPYAVKCLYCAVGMIIENDTPEVCACCQRRERIASGIVLTLVWAGVFSFAFFVIAEVVRSS